MTDQDMNINTNRQAPPCMLVIFGIAGDLVKRLLYPGICNLGSEGLLDENFLIIGVSMEPYDDESFRIQMIDEINAFVLDPKAKEYGLSLVNRLFYISGEFEDPTVYKKLSDRMDSLITNKASKNALFYYAVPPAFIPAITLQLGKTELLLEKDNYFRRVVIEKPFGHDLASAKELNKTLLSVMKEKQIFRIDHFLGKETVQNIFAFRFTNGLFEPIWNRLYIDNVQVTVAEKIGVERRGGYYENAGALRDMVPNHVFQMLSLITMEPPVSFLSDYIQNERIKVLSAVQVLTPEQVLQRTVRGQYGPGLIDSNEIIGYRSEYAVSAESTTETYAAMKLYFDNWRWLHVPFYLRTGKRLKARTTEIIIQFKSGPSSLFRGTNSNSAPNLLRIFIQPDEGISLQFNAKKPGPALQLGEVEMKFAYNEYFGVTPRTGYETILYDCMNGDHLLFNNAEMEETSWALVQPILDVWGALAPRDFPNYASGSRGPAAADELLEKDGRKWIL